MKNIIIIFALFITPLISFGQWTYKIDSIGRDTYSIANNKSLSIIKTDKDLILGINVENDKHIRSGSMEVDLVFIDTLSGETSTVVETGTYNKGFVSITTKLHNERYFKNIRTANKIEVRLRVDTDVQWLKYYFDSNNFSEAYNFLIEN